jgi:hypothetical protein
MTSKCNDAANRAGAGRKEEPAGDSTGMDALSHGGTAQQAVDDRPVAALEGMDRLPAVKLEQHGGRFADWRLG